MVKRIKLTFDRFPKGDRTGKRSGKPRFKGKGSYRSFTYPQASIDWINGKFITLPKIGAVKVIWHRPLPDSFSVKTAILSKKANGWYITLTLEDQSAPVLTSNVLEIEKPTPSRRAAMGVMHLWELQARRVEQPHTCNYCRLKFHPKPLTPLMLATLKSGFSRFPS